MKKTVQTAPRNMNAEVVAAIAGERARVSSILESPQAKGREKVAVRLALHSDMAVADALDLLASTPTEENPFVQYMNQVGPSGVPMQTTVQELDAKQARLAQLKEIGNHLNVTRGYKKAR